ncbi:MAG: indole acetimide hydrolase, partial [Ilumatobacter sp.]|nr:indole acetimide hydrolase [Ilumatobacter sp.]
VTVAVMPDPPGGETHSEIADAVRRAGDALADAGHRVVEATPPGHETALELWADLLIADLTVGRPLLELVLSTDAVAVIDALMARYEAPSLQSSIELHGLRYRTMRAWSEFFTEHQVLLSPTWALPAFEHDADLGAGFSGILSDTLRPVLPANVLGLPAAVVPAGLAAGLPVGVQVIGDRFTDLRCLTIAESIESATGGSVGPIDPVTS